MQGVKQSKRPKDKLSIMKKFLMGEDVVDSILNDGIPRITGMLIYDDNDLAKLSVEEQNELELIKDERQRRERLHQIIKANHPNEFIWFETLTRYQPCKKRFPDPDFNDVHYDSPVVDLNDISDSSDVSGRSDKIKTDACNEPVMSSQALQARELTNRSKQYLTDKLRQFAEQEKIALEEREQIILWKRMNSSL